VKLTSGIFENTRYKERLCKKMASSAMIKSTSVRNTNTKRVTNRTNRAAFQATTCMRHFPKDNRESLPQ
jgi:hypothetical protein